MFGQMLNKLAKNSQRLSKFCPGDKISPNLVPLYRTLFKLYYNGIPE